MPRLVQRGPGVAILDNSDREVAYYGPETGDVGLIENAGTHGTIVQAATVNVALANGQHQTILVTTNAAITIGPTVGNVDADTTCWLTIEVANNSGGVMGAITWDASFLFAGKTWANPATTKKRQATFIWNGAAWVCTDVSGADY